MPVSTKIEVIDPHADKPVARLIVPGDIVIEQIRKEIRIGVRLSVDLGDKKRRKTFTIKIFDENLRKALEEYINNMYIVLSTLTTEENIKGEYKLGEIKTE